MIPKVIHYCWFGKGGMNALHRRCVDSWRRIAPDYELRLWNEDNSNLDNEYCQAAIKQQKWAFVSDWVRFDVLHKEGGIYLDTDLELVRPMDSLLEHSAAVLGWESRRSIGTAFLAAPAGDPVMAACRRLILDDLVPRKLFATSPAILLKAVDQLRDIEHTILPREVFFPFNPFERDNPDNAGQFMYSDVTAQTLGIHHFRLDASWHDGRVRRAWQRALNSVKLRAPWGITFQPWPATAAG